MAGSRFTPLKVDLGFFLSAAGLQGYVEALTAFISSIPTGVSRSLIIDGDYGAGKSSVVSGISQNLRMGGVMVVDIDVSVAKSTEPLLAHIILAARRQLARQLHSWHRPLRLARMYGSVMRTRRQSFAALKNCVVLALYASIIWYAGTVLFYFGPQNIVRWIAETDSAKAFAAKGAKAPVAGRSGPAVNGEGLGTPKDGFGDVIMRVAEPGVLLVLALVLVRYLEKVLPMPSRDSLSFSFGEEMLRRRFAFDREAADELASTVRSLARGQKVCLVLDGLDQSDPVRIVETMTVIRWLSSHCLYPLVTITTVEYMYLSGAILSAHKDFFEQLVHIFRSDDGGDFSGLSSYVVGPFAGTEVLASDTRIEIVRQFIERLFDVGIMLPRLSESAVTALYTQTLPSLRLGYEGKLAIDDGRYTQLVVMASTLLGGNPRRANQFLEEFLITWHVLNASGAACLEPDRSGLTPEQAAKLLLAFRLWPTLRSDVYRRPTLLEELEGIARENASPIDLSKQPTLQRWAAVAALRALLKYGEAATSERSDVFEQLQSLQYRNRFSLQNANVDLLLYSGKRSDQVEVELI